MSSRGEEDPRGITPNNLLLGRSKQVLSSSKQFGDDDNLGKRMQLIQDMEQAFYKSWKVEVFPHLLPYKKWRNEVRNLAVGDVVLVLYDSKMVAGDYRLARIVEVHPDPHGVIRTVTVAYQPRDSRERVSKKPPYLKNKELVHLRLGVQRICVIQPVEEQEGVG